MVARLRWAGAHNKYVYYYTIVIMYLVAYTVSEIFSVE